MAAIVEALKRAVPTSLKGPYREAVERRAQARLEAASISRREFLGGIKAAVEGRRGYATGKIGACAETRMYYEVLLSRRLPADRLREHEAGVLFDGLKQEGLFPQSLDFYLRYNRFYVEQIRNLDCLGITRRPASKEVAIFDYYGLDNRLIHYPLQEPDRSVPSDEANCYLPFFEGRKILIVCPFAGFLRERAAKETFEAVWSKTGKRWFHPAGVEALEFPYGFTPSTHARYGTALDLLNDIQAGIAERDFDVALVGAAGLAIPIVSFVKSLGKVGIDLGGALQFVFGVSGKRWQDWEDYKSSFFNEHWTTVPERYRPRETDVCDNGAYW